MKLKPLPLALALTCSSLAMAENSSTEMGVLRGRLEKQMTEILALDAEIQSLSNRLGREGTPLPRREPERPAPEPAPLPAPAPAPSPDPPPPPSPDPGPAPTPPVEVRPAVPLNEVPPVTAPPPPVPAPPPMPDVAVVTPPIPPPPPPPAPVVEPVAPPPTPPVVVVQPPAPPPVDPIPPSPPVVRPPEPVAPPVVANANEVTVQPGDTLSAIARRNKTTVAELLKVNPGLVPEKLQLGQKIKLKSGSAAAVAVAPVAPPETTNTQPTAPAVSGSYVVQSGDTMHSIARRSGTTVDALCRINGIANPSTIQIGMKLKLPDGTSVAAPAPSTQPTEPEKPRIPTPGTHIVKPGDTLSSISRQTNTPIDELRKVNNLKDDTIHPGQSLKIRRGPAGGGASPSTTTPPRNNDGASVRPAAKPAAAAQGVEMAEYTVHLGDSIFSIAKRYFLSREELAAMNSLPVDAPLQEGQKIRLPASALVAARLTESESLGN
ncbi:MAG: LysM peptidoglycan-binding domain-containing protein [Verrucomicrobiales bacterium]